MEYFQDTRDAIARLAWRHALPQNTVWTSEAADGIDYYFIGGPVLNTVMAEYRGLTGQAPMPPKWALGYWQSKERYGSQQEWLDIAQEYRSRRDPIDNIVQDFLYWEPYPWGSNAFDPKRYPDPTAAIARLHDDYHLHLMISVWGKFYPGSPDNPDRNYDVMKENGFLYPPQSDSASYYDAFSPAARARYWSFLRDQLFSKGVDAWWLDASEPEVDMQAFRQVQTAQGLASLVLNAWPLMHTTGVYEGPACVRTPINVCSSSPAPPTPDSSVMPPLPGPATSPGDWDTFGRQIPAGLDFCLSGIPYWTTDIGGFFVNYPGGSENPEYRELFTRWFEWGAFCPIFRVHGTNTPKELWRFGPQFEPILVRYDSLRYRLMPYIYSQAWQVTAHAGTIMRALVMDFPSGCVRPRKPGRVPVRSGVPRLPGHPAGGDLAIRLPAVRDSLDRLLDRPGDMEAARRSRHPHRLRRCRCMSGQGASSPWGHSCNMLRRSQRTRSSCGSIGGQMARSRSTRMRGTAMHYERGVYATSPHLAGTRRNWVADHRRAQGDVSGDAAAADVPGHLGESRQRNRAGNLPVGRPGCILRR